MGSSEASMKAFFDELDNPDPDDDNVDEGRKMLINLEKNQIMVKWQKSFFK